jgi:hypothetical protein
MSIIGESRSHRGERPDLRQQDSMEVLSDTLNVTMQVAGDALAAGA